MKILIFHSIITLIFVASGNYYSNREINLKKMQILMKKLKIHLDSCVIFCNNNRV